MVKNLPAMPETWVQSLGQDISWRREWLPTAPFLPGEFHGLRSLAGYSPWSCQEHITERMCMHACTHTHTYLDTDMLYTVLVQSVRADVIIVSIINQE